MNLNKTKNRRDNVRLQKQMNLRKNFTGHRSTIIKDYKNYNRRNISEKKSVDKNIIVISFN